ncbi:hypothetical membrane protein [Bartonella grahamii as4aup]|uniref:Hypothetical membrane protein n=1 Tax=Bartonella grahamii (strain as4aup) TaxID=634504 RepID=C6AAD6_BARGA|nr:hypothetical protein [Bartonella grahamii]ACS51875.1 hypothetical membrane protein [Bartonella grahamii as4aup]
MQEKNATFGESFFSFKKLTVPSVESRKGVGSCKIIGRSFFVMFCTCLIMMTLEVPAGAKSLVEPLQWTRWEGFGSLIFLLPVLIWFCLLTPLPILWGLRSVKERRLEKIKKKLKEEIKQREIIQ